MVVRWGAMPSSVIRGWHYDATTRTLDVRFVSGRRYRYREVPPEIAQGLAEAPSKGIYFNRRIRDRYAFVEG